MEKSGINTFPWSETLTLISFPFFIWFALYIQKYDSWRDASVLNCAIQRFWQLDTCGKLYGDKSVSRTFCSLFFISERNVNTPSTFLLWLTRTVIHSSISCMLSLGTALALSISAALQSSPGVLPRPQAAWTSQTCMLWLIGTVQTRGREFIPNPR